jgi:hypothetical protein
MKLLHGRGMARGRHPLARLLAIAAAAVPTGARSFTAIERTVAQALPHVI